MRNNIRKIIIEKNSFDNNINNNNNNNKLLPRLEQSKL